MHVYVTWWCIKNVLKKNICEDNACWAGWGGFGGFTAAAISCSLCEVGTRGCEWAETHGWLKSWWQTRETLSDNLADTHSSGLNSSAAFILESNRRLLPFGEKPKSVETNGLRLNVRRTGRMFCKDCYCCCWCCCTGRGCTKEREWQQTKSKRRRATKEGNAGHVCAKKRCPRSVTHLSNSVVHASFMLFWGSSSSSRTWKNKRVHSLAVHLHA